MTPDERQPPMTADALSPMATPWWNFPERHRRMRLLQKRLKALDARITYSIEAFQNHDGSAFEGEFTRQSDVIDRRNVDGAEEF